MEFERLHLQQHSCAAGHLLIHTESILHQPSHFLEATHPSNLDHSFLPYVSWQNHGGRCLQDVEKL